MVASNRNGNNRERQGASDPEFTGKGVYIPEGEGEGGHTRFTAAQVARAFGVGIEHVHRAMRGEFGFPPDGLVDSTQAHRLVEVLLTDEPLEQREAALMRLGAYTPRRDHDWGKGETDPEADRGRHHTRDDEDNQG